MPLSAILSMNMSTDIIRSRTAQRRRIIRPFLRERMQSCQWICPQISSVAAQRSVAVLSAPFCGGEKAG